MDAFKTCRECRKLIQADDDFGRAIGVCTACEDAERRECGVAPVLAWVRYQADITFTADPQERRMS
jgi:hypothetical protein